MNREEIKEWANSARATTPINSFYQNAVIAADELIDQQAAELERLRDQMRWKPIETAPMDGTHIIAWRGTANTPHCESMYWCSYWDADRGGDWHWVQDGDCPRDGCGPTHWMPLPEPPK